MTDRPVIGSELILRDRLALERTRLANVRTLFSYLRTALYLLTAGIGVLQIKSISHLDGLAWVCIVSGVILFFFGFVCYFRTRRRLEDCIRREQQTDDGSPRLPS